MRRRANTSQANAGLTMYLGAEATPHPLSSAASAGAPPRTTAVSTRRQYFQYECTPPAGAAGGAIPSSPASRSVSIAAIAIRCVTPAASLGSCAAATAPCSSLIR